MQRLTDEQIEELEKFWTYWPSSQMARTVSALLAEVRAARRVVEALKAFQVARDEPEQAGNDVSKQVEAWQRFMQADDAMAAAIDAYDAATGGAQ